MIENDRIRVEIAEKGAELMSIVLKEDKTEYLWQGDPTYWAGRAYNLFPICGRLWEGKYTFEGSTYEMLLHGFARNTVYQVAKKSADAVTFLLTDSAESRAMYPFSFELYVSYTLEDAAVKTSFRVVNKSTGPLYFALGGHPGFNVPLGGEGSFEDYFLEFKCEKPARKLLMQSCYMTDETVPLPQLRDGRFVDLTHNLFDDDAIFMKDMCKTVTLKNRKGNKAVILHYPDMNYLGLWHKPQTEAPYVCIEPWYSVPAYHGQVDELTQKKDMIRLEQGGEYHTYFTIAIQ